MLVNWGRTRGSGAVMCWFSYSTEVLVSWGGTRGCNALFFLLYRDAGESGGTRWVNVLVLLLYTVAGELG